MRTLRGHPNLPRAAALRADDHTSSNAVAPVSSFTHALGSGRVCAARQRRLRLTWLVIWSLSPEGALVTLALRLKEAASEPRRGLS